jgi:hypothetical protein
LNPANSERHARCTAAVGSRPVWCFSFFLCAEIVLQNPLVINGNWGSWTVQFWCCAMKRYHTAAAKATLHLTSRPDDRWESISSTSSRWSQRPHKRIQKTLIRNTYIDRLIYPIPFL